MNKLTVMQQRVVDMANMHFTIHGPEYAGLTEEYILQRASKDEVRGLKKAIKELVSMGVLGEEYWGEPNMYDLDLTAAIGRKPSNHRFEAGREVGQKEVEAKIKELEAKLAKADALNRELHQMNSTMADVIQCQAYINAKESGRMQL